MTNRDHLVEQHILQHESHLKHIDEMLRRAHEHVEEGKAPPEAKEELEEIKNERERLAEHVREMKRKSAEELERETMEHSGPMAIWDAVALRLEKLFERFD
jgi:hypothetical protein